MEKQINNYNIQERKEYTRNFLKEVYFEFRRVGLKWAKLSRQTSFFPKGYLGQNLVSLVTGIPGTGTAARGDDLKDGSEVKTCARVDQLNNCKNCKARVASYLKKCPQCNSEKIIQMTDSHWICPINELNYKKYREEMPHIYFLLVDSKNLSNLDLARFTIWSIEPKTNKYWKENYIDDYYINNYTRRRNLGQKPAPMNVHPQSPKFNNTTPELLFQSTISKKGIVTILKFPQ